MKRKLTEEERSFTEKGLKNMKGELINYQEELNIYEDSFKFVFSKRIYEDKIRPFNRKEENKQWRAKIVLANSKIQEVTKSIKDLEIQLKQGVNQKEVKGVG